MTLDKDDLKTLGELIENKIDSKLGKNLEKVAEVVDQKNYDFFHEIISPALDSLYETQTKELRKVEDRLDTRIDSLENSNARIERKLDQVTDMLAVRVTDHEKRITRIEMAIA